MDSAQIDQILRAYVKPGEQLLVGATAAECAVGLSHYHLVMLPWSRPGDPANPTATHVPLGMIARTEFAPNPTQSRLVVTMRDERAVTFTFNAAPPDNLERAVKLAAWVEQLRARAPQPAPQPAAQPLPRPAISLSLQGVDRQWKVNGAFEAVEIGAVNEDYVLRVFQNLMAQAHPAGPQFCPITVTATGPVGRVAFLVGNGKIEEAGTRRTYTPQEAIRRVTVTAAPAPTPAPAPAAPPVVATRFVPATSPAPAAAAGPATAGVVCDKCGKPIAAQMRFCVSCGAPRPQAPPACTKCRAPAEAGAKFCGHCGGPVA